MTTAQKSDCDELLVALEMDGAPVPRVDGHTMILTDDGGVQSANCFHLNEFVSQDILDEARDFFLKMSHLRDSEGRLLREIVGDEIFWWAQVNWLYHGSYETIHLGYAYMVSKALREAIRRLRPKSIRVCTGNGDILTLIRDVSELSGIPVSGRISHGKQDFIRRFAQKHVERLKLVNFCVNRFRTAGMEDGFRPCDVLCFHGMSVLRQAPADAGGPPRVHIPYFGNLHKRINDLGYECTTVALSDRWLATQTIRDARQSGHLLLESLLSATESLQILARATLPGRYASLPCRLPAEIVAAGMHGVMCNKLQKMAAFRKPYVEMIMKLLGRLLDKTRPQVGVAVSAADTVGKCFVRACHERGIPVVQIGHGFNHRYDFAYCHLPEDFSTNLREMIPDQMLVFGPYSKDMLRKYGNLPEDRIKVVGMISDRKIVANLKASEDPGYLEGLGIPAGKKRVVLITQPLFSMKERIEILEESCRAMRGRQDAVLVIKPHPVEEKDFEWMRDICSKQAVDAVFVSGTDLQKLLRHAALMITQCSAVALDALALDCPVITLNLTRQRELLPFAESGACEEVNERGKLGPVIDRLLGDAEYRLSRKPFRDKFVYDQIYIVDGKAEDRILETILQRVKRRNRCEAESGKS